RTTARGAGAPPPPNESYPATPAHARSATEAPARPSSPGDDESETLRGETSRSALLPRRPAPDTIDPELPQQARLKPPTSPGDMITARPSVSDFSPPERTKRPSDVTIGQSIIKRESSSKRTWVLLVGLGAAGAAATAVTLMATRGDDTVNKVDSSSSNAGAVPALTPERLFGTIKFMIEPPDAEIKLVEKKLDHAGSPWTTQLEPGVHQIQIHREGYKSWLTSIELSANETQTLRVVLEPMSTMAIAEATLVLTSTPLGLEASLDGRLLGVTPIKAQIKPGPHTIVLRQNGAEVWRQDLNARSAATHEFSPSMDEAKQRERAQRAAPVARREPTPAPIAEPAPTTPAPIPPVMTPDAMQVATQPLDKTVEKPAVPEPAKPIATTPTPTPPAPTPPAVKPPPTPAIATTAPAPIPAAAPRNVGPVLVPPSKVTRISGAMPTLGKSKRAEVPSVVAAKVCIDTTGKVSSVDMITKLERLTSVDLSHAVHLWRYQPYKQNAVAVPACFVVSFRVQ
ncbi:MAG: PEGA domain-containing protein, partial [Deltaproteobacteria bacterium]|nr:PEGA domain-containing protein [Deltaproteobacteria bacterium]